MEIVLEIILEIVLEIVLKTVLENVLETVLCYLIVLRLADGPGCIILSPASKIYRDPVMLWH